MFAVRSVIPNQGTGSIGLMRDHVIGISGDGDVLKAERRVPKAGPTVHVRGTVVEPTGEIAEGRGGVAAGFRTDTREGVGCGPDRGARYGNGLATSRAWPIPPAGAGANLRFPDSMRG